MEKQSQEACQRVEHAGPVHAGGGVALVGIDYFGKKLRKPN